MYRKFNGKICIDFQQENDPDKNQETFVLLFNTNRKFKMQCKFNGNFLYRFSVEKCCGQKSIDFQQKNLYWFSIQNGNFKSIAKSIEKYL